MSAAGNSEMRDQGHGETRDPGSIQPYSEAYLVPNPLSPNQAIFIDEQLCKGCNKCVDVCRSDVMVKSSRKGEPPVVLYPDECWFCGCCVAHCPVAGAIRVEFPLHQRVGWKRKETGEYFRIGMKDPPPPNTRPAVGQGPSKARP